MTSPLGSAQNVANDNSKVDIMANVIQGDVIYQSQPEDPPRKKFETARALLYGGMPTRARQLLDEVVTSGQASSEVWFHWLLALLSGRPSRQFSKEDYDKLSINREKFPVDGQDKWARGLRTMCRLLDTMNSDHSDLRMVLKELDDLGHAERDQILRHLELFLRGPLEDEMWRRATDRVRDRQFENDRMQRAWKFFQAVPARPRVRRPKTVTVSKIDSALTIVGMGLGVLSVGYLGRLLLTDHNLTTLIVFAATLAVGGLCVAAGLEWRFRLERLHAAKEHNRRRDERRIGHRAEDGFTSKVDWYFQRYTGRYAPKEAERRKRYRAETAAIRRELRDEIVDVYREERVTAEEVAWLIRHRIRTVHADWRAGRLKRLHEQWKVSLATKAIFIVGLAVTAAGAVWTLVGAITAEALPGLAGTLVLLLGGVTGLSGWCRGHLERRGFASDWVAGDRRLVEDERALKAWQDRLADAPKDPEMATWLDFDRKLLLDAAMNNYKLLPSNVIAHAVIEAPPREGVYRSARVTNGPWRYSRYQLLVFLLTADGIREVTVELDFLAGKFHHWRRANYRFDAVAAVRVREGDNGDRTFELALVNGQSINVGVAGSSDKDLQPKDNSKILMEAALDATGLRSTLYVLEGVAAEGKEWVRLEQDRQDSRLQNLSDVVDGVLD
jgi:hypothetical protein